MLHILATLNFGTLKGKHVCFSTSDASCLLVAQWSLSVILYKYSGCVLHGISAHRLKPLCNGIGDSMVSPLKALQRE